MYCLSKLKLCWTTFTVSIRSCRSKSIGNLGIFIRILSYSSKRDRMFLGGSCLASVCAGSTLPLMNLLFAGLIGSFSSMATSGHTTTPQVFMVVINKYVLYIVYLFIGRLLLSYIAVIGFRIASLRISATIRLRYLQALFRQPISTLDVIPPGQTTAIITMTANILQIGISERLSSLIQAVSVIVVALIIGCVFSWQLTLVTASGLVAIVIWYQIITPRIAQKYAAVQKLETEAAGTAAEALSSIKMIAAYGAEKRILETYSKVVQEIHVMNEKLSPMLAIQHSPVFFTTYATFALCFWFALKLYMRAEFVNIKTLVVVLMSVLTMLAHISAVSVPLTAAFDAINAAKVFFTIIDAPFPSTLGMKVENAALNADIVLENVNFTYATRHNTKVLEDINLTIPAGKTTAIVGPSGSGKSTTVALIQRWYELGGIDPVTCFFRNGSIKIGKRNLHEFDLYWWRSRIGLVQQEPFLFNDTILKNVEYGLVGTEWEYAPRRVKEQLIYQSCKEAFADDFIARLPEGYHTMVGQKGLHLSGGQRQRIAIARAIVRNPQILIFDEATSALDVTSERIVQTALNRAAKSRTTIIIAHRLSTIRDADQIVVLAKGKIVQTGTHGELLRDEGSAYWKLVNVQKLNASSATRSLQESHKAGISVRKSLVVRHKGQKSKIDTTSTAITKHTAASTLPPVSMIKTFASLFLEQKKNWSGYLILTVASLCAAACTPLQAYLFGRLISSFSRPIPELLGSINFLCLMLFFVAVGIGLSYFTIGWISNAVSTRTVTFYRKDYLQSMIHKPISFFDSQDNSVGLLTAFLATDPAQLQQLLGANMAMALIAVFSLVGCISIALIFHWKFALVVIAPSLPIILAGGWYRVRYEVEFEARNSKVFGESAQFATEAIEAIRTVASLTLERVICEKYENLLKSHVTESWKKARLSSLSFAGSDSMVLLCMAFALWYGGNLLAHSEITSFEFLVVYLAIIQGTLAAGQWLSFGPNVAQVSAAATRIKSIRSGNTDYSNALSRRFWRTYQWQLPASLLCKEANIELQDVWFTYPERDVPVLRGLSLSVRHGQFAAIVGSSGSGKTTIISLLERFYNPQQGSIFYNSHDISDLPIETLRRKLSLVAQEPTLFRGTLRGNIMLGIEDEMYDEERFLQACRDSGIEEFVSSLPDGFNTNIGTAGVLLSGGQKQRISIARALIRNPTVLLLDEATSSLDSESEKQIQAVLARSAKGRTTIVVAHRLSTIQKADVIFVMDQGTVVEKGTHESLLHDRGVYWGMCEGQTLDI